MKALVSFAALVLAFSAAQGRAQGMSMATEARSATTASSSALPFVNAEVKAVDAAKGSVTLQHEDITNLNMPRMTMAFPVADKTMLKGVKAGDKVRFQADMVKGITLVTRLEPKR